MWKSINAIYDNKNSFISELVDKYEIPSEKFNIDYPKEAKKAREIMVRNGTRNVPLITFIDSEGIESKVLWSENTDNWEEAIDDILNKYKKQN